LEPAAAKLTQNNGISGVLKLKLRFLMSTSGAALPGQLKIIKLS
jgi:hypothetical protein